VSGWRGQALFIACCVMAGFCAGNLFLLIASKP